MGYEKWIGAGGRGISWGLRGRLRELRELEVRGGDWYGQRREQRILRLGKTRE